VLNLYVLKGAYKLTMRHQLTNKLRHPYIQSVYNTLIEHLRYTNIIYMKRQLAHIFKEELYFWKKGKRKRVSHCVRKG